MIRNIKKRLILVLLLVLGAKLDQGDTEFNPPATLVLNPGQTLIVMGDVADIARAKRAF